MVFSGHIVMIETAAVFSKINWRFVLVINFWCFVFHLYFNLSPNILFFFQFN